MTISEGTFGSVDDLFDAGISGTYASIRTYSNYAEAWCLWSDKDSTPSEAQARLPAFSTLRPFSRRDFESVRPHLLRGCMTLKLMHSISVDENPDLAITSALWLPVQAYYAVHGFGMAFLVAKNGANNLPLTHGAFMRTAGQSLVRDLLPSPFSAVLQDGYRGYQYLRPELVNVDDDRDYIGSGFNLQGLNATTRDAHIAQCLDTTRRRLIDEKLVKERAKARRKGKLRGILRRERQIEIARSVAPTTVLDYLYRARIKSNYEDPTMYSESPEDAAALLALVRNTQKLTVMLCAFVVAALRRTIDEPAQNQLVEMSVFKELQPDLSNSIDGMH